MLECLIVGDSIAVGVSQVRPECQSIAKSGINSRDWTKQHLNKISKPTKNLIISLGANDFAGINTEGHLRSLRTNASAVQVYWILPSTKLKPRQVEAVWQVALEFDDIVITRPEDHISKDGVHPTYRGYRILADQTR